MKDSAARRRYAEWQKRNHALWRGRRRRTSRYIAKGGIRK